MRNTNDKERFTNGWPVLTTDHEMIHDGQAFRIVGESASIASGAHWHLSFRTPAAGYIHMRPAAFGTSANVVRIRITEGESYTGGSALTPRNQNRNSSRASGVVAAGGTTVTPAGTLVDEVIIGSGGNAATRGGGAGGGQNDEIILDQDTVYNIDIENIGQTTATIVAYNIFYYEEAYGA